MRHVADLMADIVKFLRAENRDLSAGGLAETCESAEQRGLSCAIIAQDGIELSAGELGGDAAQGGEAAKLLDQVGDGDDGCGFSHRLKANLPSRWNWSSDFASCSCRAGRPVWLLVGADAARISVRTWL